MQRITDNGTTRIIYNDFLRSASLWEIWELYAGTYNYNECWTWLGPVTTGGKYGRFKHKSKEYSAHRTAYEFFKGPIGPGLEIDHTCHNNDESCPGGPCPHRLCVNPLHLEAVTSLVNTRRSRTKFRKKTHCVNGHKLVESNIYRWRNAKDGYIRQKCKICIKNTHKRKVRK